MLRGVATDVIPSPPIGEMISELARRALTAPQESSSVKEPKAVYGLRPFPARGGIVTNELIDKLRDDDAY